MGIFSSLLSIFYLLRSYKHFSTRTNWYISSLLLLFFLTSIYKITYLDYILSLKFFDLNVNFPFDLIDSWFSGNASSLLIFGLLFIVIKSSLYKINPPLFIELFFVSIGSIILLIKTFSPINYIPIILPIIFVNIFHLFKNKNLCFIFKDIKLNTFKVFNSREKINLLVAILFVICSLLTNFNLGNLLTMSNAHIYRIIFIFMILILSLSTNYFYTKKMIYNIFPVSLIFGGFIISSILTNVNIETDNYGVLTLECFTAVAFFPIIELLISKYHLLGSYQNYNSILKFKNNLFNYCVKIFLSLLILTYILFVFSQ